MQVIENRRLFFDRLNRITTTRELLAFQKDIARAIIDAERKLTTGKYDSKKLQFHIQRLRLYADTLVWWNVHPHAIRQLAKNLGPAQSLLGQGDAFHNVLSHAERYQHETRLPILIADITNVIKVGDIVVVSDPEHPQIVECKMKLPKPKHLMQGRIGRQVSRAMGTMQYLKEGAGKIFGQDYYGMAVKSQHRADRNWQAIDRLCSQALRLGEAYEEISNGDHLWAIQSGYKDRIISNIDEKAESLGTVQLGTSLGLMNFQDGLFPPPSAWRPVSPEVRFELTEGTIILFHLVSYDALAGNYGDGQRIAIRDTDFPIVVSIDDRDYPLSRRFIYDIIYGFETMQSCVKGLLTFAHELTPIVTHDFPDIPNIKPQMWYVETTEDIGMLFKQDGLSSLDYVSMPRHLADSLAGTGQIRQSRGQSLAVMPVEVLQKLINKPPGISGTSLQDCNTEQ